VSTPTLKPPPPRGDSNSNNSLLATRRGSLIAAAITAFLAVILLLLFLSQYRNSVGDTNKTETVLVARSLLPKGSTGEVVAANGMFQAVNVKHSQVKNGALTDPAALRGKVTTQDVFAGQQITTGDLSTSQDRVINQITGKQRAISVAVDAEHGLVGSLQAGDHVDVYGAFNAAGSGGQRAVLKEIQQNVLVLKTPSSGGGGAGSSNQQTVTLRATDDIASQLAFAAENGAIWLTLRPQAGAQQDPPSLTTLQSVLSGAPVVKLGGGQ
jgi:Flp pilus assembly protein CpaB